jgi:hypothetical protein
MAPSSKSWNGYLAAVLPARYRSPVAADDVRASDRRAPRPTRPSPPRALGLAVDIAHPMSGKLQELVEYGGTSQRVVGAGDRAAKGRPAVVVLKGLPRADGGHPDPTRLHRQGRNDFDKPTGECTSASCVHHCQSWSTRTTT